VTVKARGAAEGRGCKVTISKQNISSIALALAVLLAALASDHLVLEELRSDAIARAMQRQERSLETFRELLQVKGREFRVADGRLWAGSYQVNGNNEIPDKLLALTGSRATIFLGATRVATNIRLKDGRRALGTRLEGPAYQALFRNGIPYRGEAQILGTRYFTAYDPIRDGSGAIIGALFVGAQRSEFLSGYRRIAMRIRAINFSLSLLVLLCGWRILRERKKAQERLQEQLDFLQLLSDTIPSPIFSKDTRLLYTGCNRAMQSFLGLDREEVIGKTVHEVSPQQLAELYDLKDRELMEGESPTQIYEAQVRQADGSLRDVVFYKARFCKKDGTPEGMVGVILDITERKAAEQELRNAYRRTADILEFLPDGSFVVDAGNRVIAWNRAIEKMTGVPKEQMLGKQGSACAAAFYGETRAMLIDLVDAEAELIEQNYQNGRRDGRTIFGEIALERRQGEERIFRAAAAPLFDREGKRSGAIQTVRDVTELRRATQQRQVLEAQREYAMMMESLMMQLSHDLRTPLTPLFALLPMLRRSVEDPKLQRQLDICSNSAAQIHALAEKSLQLVRFSSGESLAVLQEVPLAELTEGIAAETTGSLRERGVNWKNRIPRELRVLADPEQLTLLVSNILSNAARYAAAGGEVTVGADAAQGMVTVSIRDDGAGLAPGHSSLIFQEFFKEDQARQDLNTQGLGLAICKRIVQNHGGRIWAESAGKGAGTTIFFTLKGAPPPPAGLSG
jgi:PAS domain S-box-containing protein